MKNKRSKLKQSGFIALMSLVLFIVPFGSAFAEDPDASGLDAVSDVDMAAQLGILLGSGQGLTAEYLAQPTTRLQAAIMYLRLKGLEQEAENFAGTDNYADAGQLSGKERNLLAYLKAHPELGWVGSGDNLFQPLDPVTSQQFYKVMLSALGYESGTDFAYDDTLAFAASLGLYTVSNRHPFVNRDIATAAVQTLGAKVKGSSQTLAGMLEGQGILSTDQAGDLAYPRLNLMTSDTLGDYLTDSKGMTLYYFTKDAADPNSCQGGCLTAWPIYSAADIQIPAGLNPDDFSIFTRTDGNSQLMYKGWPLYYFAGDEQPGDTNGEDANHVWFVIKVPEYTVDLGTSADLGNYLTDDQGRTLYYFTKDSPGQSNCSGSCLTAWPAFHAAASAVVPTGLNAADFGEITRADGAKQTTYQGYPLYYYAGDQQRGDVTGQGVKQVWYVIQPGAFPKATETQAEPTGY